MNDSARQTHSFRRALLWLGAAAPVLLSLVFHAIGATPQPAQPGEPRPALAFDQYMVNLGTVEQVGILPAWFSFTNRGRQKVHISELETSCGCLVPRIEQRDYEVGEQGMFRVYVDTPSLEPGPKEYFITVKYEEPEPRETRLTFKMNLPDQPVTVRPKGLMFYLSETAIEPREIVVTDKRQPPLRVTGIESTSPFVTGSLMEVTDEDAGLGQTRVSVSVDPQTPAGTKSLLILTTTDPKFPKLHVPVFSERVGGAIHRQADGAAHSHQHQ